MDAASGFIVWGEALVVGNSGEAQEQGLELEFYNDLLFMLGGFIMVFMLIERILVARRLAIHLGIHFHIHLH